MPLRAWTIPAVLLVAGCSSNNPENDPVVCQPVSGKVIYDGKAAAGVVVTLVPTDAPMPPRIPRNPFGVTREDGTFSITTFNEGDGAAEGGYQIVLAWPAANGEDMEEEAEDDHDRLKGWYDAKHSNLSFRVEPGDNTIPTLNLPKVTQPPPEVQGVPGRN